MWAIARASEVTIVVRACSILGHVDDELMRLNERVLSQFRVSLSTAPTNLSGGQCTAMFLDEKPGFTGVGASLPMKVRPGDRRRLTQEGVAAKGCALVRTADRGRAA